MSYKASPRKSSALSSVRLADRPRERKAPHPPFPGVSSMKDTWLKYCLELSGTKADMYSGCRKIIRHFTASFSLDDSMKMRDCGYTSNKLTLLTKNYLHEESRRIAIDLWDRRKAQGRYGSVSFTTFNHFVKGKGTLEEIVQKKSKRASVFGPCIQSVCLTLVAKDRVSIDIFYRTTEWFKKFGADLVFIRDVLLEPFDFTGMKVEMHFHFANVTAHPMYAITFLPHLDDPIEELIKIKKKDKYFHDWMVKWSGRYICPEYHRGIAKFSQALRVQKDAYDRLSKTEIAILRRYLRDNHPGYRGDYAEDEEDEE